MWTVAEWWYEETAFARTPLGGVCCSRCCGLGVAETETSLMAYRRPKDLSRWKFGDTMYNE